MSDAIPTIGGITLTPLIPAGAALQMTTDPDSIVDAWGPRKFTEAGLEGASTTQDFGQFAVDCKRTLGWRRQMLDVVAIRTLRSWMATTGSTYRYEDDEGNDWTVELVPPFSANRVFGLDRLYTCTLTLHVLAMTHLYAETYTGE